tara:strand:- start:1097 stop:1342 length:246 start_codon:yes stop_codon:yes gene_type:complete
LLIFASSLAKLIVSVSSIEVLPSHAITHVLKGNTVEYNLLVFTGHSSDEHIVWNKTRFNEFRVQFDTLKAAQEFVAMLVTS